jgi:hypothetical protein
MSHISNLHLESPFHHLQQRQPSCQPFSCTKSLGFNGSYRRVPNCRLKLLKMLTTARQWNFGLGASPHDARNDSESESQGGSRRHVDGTKTPIAETAFSAFRECGLRADWPRPIGSLLCPLE